MNESKTKVRALLRRRVKVATEQILASPEIKAAAEDLTSQICEEGTHPQGKALVGLEAEE
jgi:hypothetical protein